jgi:uncharacterized protein (TIGR02302 family)
VTAFPTGSSEATTSIAVRANRLIAGSRAALWWERAWLASWRGLCLLGAGTALALFDVWTYLPPGPRILALSALILSAATLFWMDWRNVFWPSRAEGIRRLEDANALPHRPIAGAEDRLAAGKGDALTEALWQRHIAQQLNSYAGLNPVWPQPNLPQKDPFAIRGVVYLSLVAGLAAAGSDAPRRLAASFAVEGDRAVLASGVALDAWITPPGYTGQPPVILAQAKGTIPLDPSRAISVPAGSKLTIRVEGSASPSIERIPLDGQAAVETDGAAAAGETDSLTSQIQMMGSERIRVFASGRKAGDWEITVLPDAPPSIAFDGEMESTSRLATRIPFSGGDDYGVTSAAAHMALAPDALDGDDPTAEESDEGLSVGLPVSGREGGKSIRSAAFEDLTAHPWAGLEVIVHLSATDAAGQTGTSEGQSFTLPQRVFRDPLAKAIIEQRRELSRGPGAIPRVATAIEALTLAPELFEMKPPVYLAMRAAYWRLMQSRVRKDVGDVQSLLWDIALSIEDGGVTLAADEVRRLQKELQAALEQNASDEEIQQLTEELRQAMRDLMQAMAEMAPGETIPLVDAQTLEPQDLEAMLDRIEEMSRLGAKDAAQELLSQLQDMMEGMQGPMAEPSETERRLAKTLNELNEIVREQEKLRDQTFRQDQDRNDPEIRNDGELPESLANEQAKIEDRLRGLSDEMTKEGAEAPGAMGEAGQAMDQAEGALRQSDTGQALAEQEDALTKLKSARDAARQALAEEQKKNGGTRVGRGMGRRQQGMDPAGRPESDGQIDNGSVKIPTERESQRARDILNELRKRSGEADRPKEELDYLERLLRRF